MIYADNAATTQLDIDAYNEMKPFFVEDYGNASQPYSFSRSVKGAIKQARNTIASCINARPEEIVFTSGGTESDNWVINGAVYPKRRNRIITTAVEHHAVLNTCEAISENDVDVSYVSVDKDGIINISELERILRDEDKKECNTLVSVMFANNEIGTIEPIQAVSELSHKYGAQFHTDAVQAVGHIDIDVRKLGIDFLSASAHKFNGPKGIGFLFLREGSRIRSFINGGAQESGRRAGTENVPYIVAMAKALENNCKAINENAGKLLELEGIIENLLKTHEIEYIRNGADKHIPGNMSLSFKGQEGEALLHRLDLMGICVSTGSACDSESTQISHVLKAIKLDEEWAKGTIRISLGKNNTEDDAIRIVDALSRIINGAR